VFVLQVRVVNISLYSAVVSPFFPICLPLVVGLDLVLGTPCVLLSCSNAELNQNGVCHLTK